MEVVPTNDGDDDDGVVWYRCPQCQGFLPKLKGATESEEKPQKAETADTPAEPTAPEADRWDSPAAMMQDLKDSPASAFSMQESSDEPDSDDDVLVGTVKADTPEPKTEPVVEDPPEVQEDIEPVKEDEPAKDVEPVLEYAAMLAELDVTEAAPYRPWATYEVGQCINHLAWNDCGVVVAKEDLPGGRKIIKCYFEEAGVVRLIEKAPR